MNGEFGEKISKFIVRCSRPPAILKFGHFRSESLAKTYGNENVTSKYKFELSYMFHDVSILFMLYNMGEVSFNEIGTYGFEAKKAKERFTVVCLSYFGYCAHLLNFHHLCNLLCCFISLLSQFSSTWKYLLMLTRAG